MNPGVQQDIDQITKTKGVVESATTLINSFQARLDAAVAKALENGATEQELAPLNQLSTELGTDTDALAAAVAANPNP